jgi:agmatine/peptidylarginine deiminase
LGAADSNLTPHAPARPGWRIPAEWEPHAATWLAWPRSDGIVPTYRSDNDERALFILRECSPGRPVTGLGSTGLIWGLGSFHCLTQQEPAGE